MSKTFVSRDQLVFNSDLREVLMTEVASPDTIKLLYCYAQADKVMRNRLEMHLEDFRERGFMEGWSELQISPGNERDSVIKDHLKTADVILLLISPDFRKSHYYKDEFMRLTWERHHNGEASVVPVLLRPVLWETPLDKLTKECPLVLPSSKKPVAEWKSQDTAFKKVAQELSKIFRYIWIKKGDKHYKAKRHELARLAYGQAIKLDRDFVPAYTRMGYLLHSLGKYQEATDFFKNAISLNPEDANAHYLLGTLLYDRGYHDRGYYSDRYEYFDRAVSSFEKALQLDDSLVSACIYKGLALEQQGKSQEARKVYEEYLKLYPHDQLVAYFSGEADDSSETKNFYEKTQQVVTLFLRSIEQQYGSDMQRRASGYGEPMQVFINTIHIFREGIRQFQKAAQPLAEDYSSWLKDLRNILRSTPAQQYVAIKNPEIREIFLSLLELETRQIEDRANLVDKIINYLQSLKDRRLYEIDAIIRELDMALGEIAKQLGERQRGSQELAAKTRSDDSETLRQTDMEEGGWLKGGRDQEVDASHPSASPNDHPLHYG